MEPLNKEGRSETGRGLTVRTVRFLKPDRILLMSRDTPSPCFLNHDPFLSANYIFFILYYKLKS